MLLRGRRIAIVSGPIRAVSMTRFLAEIGVPPLLVAVDFDSSVREKLEALAIPGIEILVEPSFDLIRQKLEEHRIDLLIGGMLELPLARALGIDHIDMMHGSQKTVGPAGAVNLVRLCGRRRDQGPC
jgi:nitrogenase molybdenum-cofactor synthesis protein NifE